jgi:signal transduction histidine kinase
MADSDAPLAFPDEPRSDLDRVLGDLVESAQKVQATQGRLRSLLHATRIVVEGLELSVVLRRIVEAAIELVGARYGAIGIVAADGSLEQFIHVGMPDDLVMAIGHLPEGHGLLGAVIADQAPIRLEHLSANRRSSGFPDGHPAMDSFLGVPVKVRGEVYGNLYLADHEGDGFSSEDEQLLVALAATAGVAIDNARLFDETMRRQRWAAATAQLTSTLLSDGIDDSLGLIADRVVQLADVNAALVMAPDEEGMLRVEVARGPLAASVQAGIFAAAGTLAGRALESEQPTLSDEQFASTVDPTLTFGPGIAVPLTVAGTSIGVLVLLRVAGRPRFTMSDLELVSDFASYSTVALELSRSRADQQRLAVLEDRGRIARDLHDHVIQRLFAAGLTLQHISGLVADPAIRLKLDDEVTALDAAITEIRTAIFTLNAHDAARQPSLRHRLIDIVSEVSDLFQTPPRISFVGPIDLMIPPELGEAIAAVLREGLSNVARHARATETSATVALVDRVVTVTITDNGIGVDPAALRNSGLANLATRAAECGGEFSLTAGAPRGTLLDWHAPVDATEDKAKA